MDYVRSFFDQQLGFSKWKNYDCALQRFYCSKDEDYKGIWGLEEHEQEVPIFACKFCRKQGSENILALANEDGNLVVHDTENGDVRHGRQIHQNAIFDIDWLPHSNKVVTVSGDHTARMVDVGDGTMVSERVFTGHTRSVKTVAVCSEDSSIFATGSRDGSIRIWDCRSSLASNVVVHPDRTINHSHCRTPTSSKKKGSMSPSVSAANSVTGLVFQDTETLISCGSGDGVIKVWDLRKTYTTSKREPFPKNVIPYSGSTTRNGFSNLIIDPSGLKLYANCLDNTIYAYNIATYDVKPVMEYRGHINSTFYIKSVVSSDGMYLLSGSSDQNAYIWNVRNEKPIVSLKGHMAEVTCVAWRSVGDFAVVTCSDDVRQKIWRLGPEILPMDSDLGVRGQAEPVCTPTSLKRQYRHTENDTPLSSAKRPRTDSHKRTLEDSNGSDAKRQNTGRRLFDLTNLPSGSRDDNLATIIEEDELSAKRPRLIKLSSPQENALIKNLPNFAVDGEAPHLNYSPQKRQDKDWLTKMRVERRLIKEMQDLAEGGPPPTKTQRLEERTGSVTPKSAKVTRRRPSRSKTQSPILRFFKVTSSSNKDMPCSPKSSLPSQQMHETNR